MGARSDRTLDRLGVRRFVVAEDSMLPTLRHGDGLLAIRSRRVRRGQIRCFQHPERPGFWLVKRVGDVSGTTFQALSDNPTASAVDSRRFGAVPIDGSYLVVRRFPTRGSEQASSLPNR